MSDWPNTLAQELDFFSSLSHNGIGIMVNAGEGLLGDRTWGTANTGFFIPFNVGSMITVKQLAIYNGATVAGNLDVGIYDAEGHRLVSSGSVAQAGVGAIQLFDITDTVLPPGLYYAALACDNATATVDGWDIGHAPGPAGYEVHQVAAVFPLPATVVYGSADNTDNAMPHILISRRATV
jgi:hypothetical protein